MARLSRAESEVLLDQFRRYLRDHGQPVTRPRDRVAQAVLLSDEHLSVDQIRRRLREDGVTVGLATIYRTLELLEQSGLVRSHDFGQGYRRFEPNPSRPGHYHLICLRCGRVEEFQHERLERILPMIADEHGFRPERQRLELYGTCRDCQRRAFG
jgi:Fur family ferric uptake transcriptional regulator